MLGSGQVRRQRRRSRIAEIAWYKGDPSSPTFAAASSLSGTGIDPNAAFVRSGAHWAGPAYTSTDGSALARSTPPSGGAFLHAVANAHRVGSTTVKDAGPYSPVLYLRSSNGGTTWTSGTRLNPTNQHGVWPGVASYGSYVYASWVKVPKVVNWTLNGRRQIWFRSNSHGGAGSWGVAKAVTSSSSRVDFPTIAAAGANIYIAYTDADTGVVRVLVSKNRGSTWTAIKLGTSAATSDAGGHSGSPSVAVSGSTVIVAWVENNAGSVRARISTNGASSWGTATQITPTSKSYPSAAANGARVGVGWIGAEPSVRVWGPGGWGPTRTVPGVDHVWLPVIYGPALVLPGSTGVGLGFSGCIQHCARIDSATLIESWYAESATDGANWYNGAPFGAAVASDLRHATDGLSVVVSGATTRDLLYTAWTPGTTTTRIVHRKLTVTSGP